MGPAEMAGEVLNYQARKAAKAVNLPLHVFGTPFTCLRNILFAEFWFRFGKSREPNAGEEFVRKTVGIMQFTIYAPVDMSGSDIAMKAAHLRRCIDGKWWDTAFGWITTDEAKIQTLSSKFRFGKAVWIVDATFDVFIC